MQSYEPIWKHLSQSDALNQITIAKANMHVGLEQSMI